MFLQFLTLLYALAASTAYLRRAVFARREPGQVFQYTALIGSMKLGELARANS